MIRQLAGLLTAGRLLFLTPFYEEIIIPVEIENGGQAVIRADQESSPMPENDLISLSGNETGSFAISFSEEGSWSYRITQVPQPDIIADTAVYSLKVTAGSDGIIKSVLLNRSESDEKAESVHFVSKPLIPSETPDTSDPGLKGYMLASFFSLLVSLIIFKAGGGNHEQM